MRKILLTAAGLETPRIREAFLGLLAVPPEQTKALFIPTAAQDADAIAVLPACMEDLLHAGIPKENIAVFDLHRPMAEEELQAFDVVYFTGGRTQYLLDRINDTGFDKTLARFVARGGIYLGVSAGSLIAANNLPHNLGYIDAELHVHAQTGTPHGMVTPCAGLSIYLTNQDALLLLDDTAQILG